VTPQARVAVGDMTDGSGTMGRAWSVATIYVALQ
jgi:hypothetical protein